MKHARALLALTFLFFAAACEASRGHPSPRVPKHGIDVAGMDRAVKPGDDFNAFANGGYLKTTEIPADKAAFGPWAVLEDATRQRTVSLIQSLASSGAAASGDTKKIGDFYAS